MKKIFRGVWIYAVLGLITGVFYREFTKFNDFTETTMLSSVHVHMITLGSIFLLIVLILNKLFELNGNKGFAAWFWFYNIALIGVLTTMVIRGVYQVIGINAEMLSHIAGTFHTLTAASLIWFMFILKYALFKKSN